MTTERQLQLTISQIKELAADAKLLELFIGYTELGIAGKTAFKAAKLELLKL